MGISNENWYNMYSDLPSKQIKLSVKDKSVIHCSEDEMEVMEPATLQESLNKSMALVEQGRCFIRPSGTEDVVRIYAEACTEEGVHMLVEDAKLALEGF